MTYLRLAVLNRKHQLTISRRLQLPTFDDDFFVLDEFATILSFVSDNTPFIL
jgi:hypothetical protein